MDVDAAGERIVVGGEGIGATPPSKPLVVAYDATDGAELWSRVFADPGVAGGTFYDVAMSPDGSRAVATGYTVRSDGKGPSTVGYDVTAGQKLWAVNSTDGLGYVVDISPDGRRTYVTGSSYSRRGSMHNTISYVTDTGTRRWGALYEETAPPAHIDNTVLYPSAMVISPDGTDVYVGGSTRPWFGEHDDALTLAYRA